MADGEELAREWPRSPPRAAQGLAWSGEDMIGINGEEVTGQPPTRRARLQCPNPNSLSTLIAPRVEGQAEPDGAEQMEIEP